MIWQHIDLLYKVIISLTLLIVFELIYRGRFFHWVRSYWFFRPKWRVYISSLLFLLSLLSFSLAILDPRGLPQKVSGQVGDNRTIIAIDLSASMMAEDVRPNRLGSAALLARAYVKSAVGQKIALYSFSEEPFMIAPFTDDADYLDARIDSLSTLPILKGGTNFGATLRYLLKEASYEKAPVNIVIFTDGEETMRTAVPSDIDQKVYVVGVGTKAGGSIPIRNREGEFIQYKAEKGKEVVTRNMTSSLKKSYGSRIDVLEEGSVSSMVKLVEKVDTTFEKNEAKKDLITRLAYGPYLIALGMILYILSRIFLFGKVFKRVVIATALIFSFSLVAEEDDKSFLTNLEKEKLAEQYLTDKDKVDLAKILLDEQDLTKSSRCESMVNAVTASFMLKDLEKGLDALEKLRPYIKDEKCLHALRNNTLLALATIPPQKGGGKSDGKDNKDGKGEKKGKDSEKKSEKQGEKGQKEKSSSAPPKSYEEKKADLKRARALVKMGPLSKKVSDEDRDLQGKFIQLTNKKDTEKNSYGDW